MTTPRLESSENVWIGIGVAVLLELCLLTSLYLIYLGVTGGQP